MGVKQEAHKHFNTILALAVIGISLYALLLPFLPAVDFWIRSKGSTEESISRQLYADESSNDDEPNALLIPSIMVDEPVIIGDSLQVIDDGGVWLRPISAAPDQPGNVILAGHRFTYEQPYGPLYHLDKVTIGDEIGVRWEGEMRHYIVESIETVPATATYVERQTNDSRLTIYTCTPLLTAENRLVITAKEHQ